jgi:pyruvate/2-oxoglutarate dehydrogenase complex dihydrolipoamide acyltransferase (E2) component
VVPTPVATVARTVEVRDIVRFVLSSDHRVIDGFAAGSFLNAVRRRLEDPGVWRAELEAGD